MHAQGIQRVLSLLGDDEAQWYSFDIDKRMASEFKAYTRVPMFRGDARSSVEKAIGDARAASEPIVVHCSGGGGRCGLGLAIGAMASSELSVEDVKKEIEAYAKEIGTKRKVDLKKLQNLLTSGNAAGSK
uniref:Tyrosine specific protein phosphatases domain-containing protein n=1 Tax=Lotharella oceanica TaxID=641309 RepID=A0A7S2U2L0_9EUKA|mmetsp:Transcript_5273/g.10473  ORF Transcript_5273/g.10473 Transcript_5273/m.10473 type:complete len:130 (+) Transcript_5273:1-390(+)